MHADIIYSHIGYDVTNYFRSAFIEVRKTTENVASDGVRSNFCGMTFCLAQPIGRVLILGLKKVVP